MGSGRGLKLSVFSITTYTRRLFILVQMGTSLIWSRILEKTRVNSYQRSLAFLLCLEKYIQEFRLIRLHIMLFYVIHTFDLKEKELISTLCFKIFLITAKRLKITQIDK